MWPLLWLNSHFLESWVEDDMDKRASKTRDAIIAAWMALLPEKKNQRITVTELAKRANIARKTFYLHYETPEDVMRDAAGESWKSFSPSWSRRASLRTPSTRRRSFSA